MTPKIFRDFLPTIEQRIADLQAASLRQKTTGAALIVQRTLQLNIKMHTLITKGTFIGFKKY